MADEQEKVEEVEVPSGTITQDQLNKILAAEKNKHNQKTQQVLDELQTLRSKATLTEEERNSLAQRIEQLSNDMLTKEELAAKQAKKNIEQFTKEKDALVSERDSWRRKFTESTIQRSLSDAATKHDAYNPVQLVTLLERRTHIVEGLDETGRANGSFTVRVKIDDVDKDGNPIQLEMSPNDALKHMKDTEGYQNLFKGTGFGGLGGGNVRSGKEPSLKDLALDPVKYRAHRAKHSL